MSNKSVCLNCGQNISVKAKYCNVMCRNVHKNKLSNERWAKIVKNRKPMAFISPSFNEDISVNEEII